MFTIEKKKKIHTTTVAIYFEQARAIDPLFENVPKALFCIGVPNGNLNTEYDAWVEISTIYLINKYVK